MNRYEWFVWCSFSVFKSILNLLTGLKLRAKLEIGKWNVGIFFLFDIYYLVK